jgi:sugar lactone lactonase YvrE
MIGPALSPLISAIQPPHAAPGAQVVLEGGPFEAGGAGLPRVRLGHVDVRVTLASRDRIRFAVPGDAEPGRRPVRLELAPGETAFLDVAEGLATGVHCVDNPAIASDGTVYVTCSGSRGQQTPVSVYRIVLGSVREIFATGVTNATSLAFDPLGRLHVTSRFDGTVSRLDPSGRPEVVAGDLGVATGLAFAPDGTLYVGDRSGTVFRVTPGGDAVPHATLPPSVAAFHLALAPDGRTLYATGPTLAPRDSVYRISPHGAVQVVTTRFGRPQGLAFGPGDRLYVVEALAGAAGVYEVSDDGASELVVAGAFVGLAFGPHGELVLVSNDTVYRLPVFVR